MREERNIFVVAGVCCSTEEAVLRKSLDASLGPGEYEFSLLTCELSVGAGTDQRRVLAGVRRAGFQARLKQHIVGEERFWKRHADGVWTVGAAILMAGGLLGEHLGWPPAAAKALLLGAILTGGWKIAVKAVKAVRMRALDMNSLMTVASAGALAVGRWDEAAAVIVLFSLALLLESYSASRTRKAVHQLMAGSPQQAAVIREAGEVRVPASGVAPGELVMIRPGDQVPLDGVVVRGSSQVNESALTGEAGPVPKVPGSQVFAGSINGRGSMSVKVSRGFRDTKLAHIVRLVEEAQHRRAPVQRFVDTFARKYTPAVLAVAGLVAVVPPLVFQAGSEQWLYRSLVLLVIACPCALVISTPVTIVGALANAARRGMLVKGGKHLEMLGKVKAIAFDKTGTLTRGHPTVTDVIPLNDLPRERLLQLVAGIEHRSEHPLADAILAEATRSSLAYGDIAIDDFEALPGLGVRASIGGKAYYLGNLQLCEQHGYCTPLLKEVVSRLMAEGKTAVILGKEREALCVIGAKDTARGEGRGAIEELRGLGIEHMALLSGDRGGAVDLLAREVGLSSTGAELMPEEKVEAVRKLERMYGSVAMVGDGINDAPALAASSVGIAMGVSGTDAALDTADIVLMADDLSRLPLLVKLSRRTMSLVRENIVIALAVKLCFLILAVTGVATLWMAILADDGAALAVIVNGLRILSFGEDA